MQISQILEVYSPVHMFLLVLTWELRMRGQRGRQEKMKWGRTEFSRELRPAQHICPFVLPWGQPKMVFPFNYKTEDSQKYISFYSGITEDKKVS